MLAGLRMLPQVSLPMAKGTSPAATEAPEPLLLPPLQCRGLQGVAQGPVKLAWGCLYPMPPASSIMASLARRTAPASSSFLTTVAS